MTYFELAKHAADVANADLGTNNIDPRYIYAQWQHESANFTSRMATENNNFAGVTQVEPNGDAAFSNASFLSYVTRYCGRSERRERRSSIFPMSLVR